MAVNVPKRGAWGKLFAIHQNEVKAILKAVHSGGTLPSALAVGRNPRGKGTESRPNKGDNVLNALCPEKLRLRCTVRVGSQPSVREGYRQARVVVGVNRCANRIEDQSGEILRPDAMTCLT